MERSKTRSFVEKIAKNTWASILSSVIGVLTSLLASIATIADMKSRQPLIFGIVAGFVILLVVAEVTTSYLRRGPSRDAVLKSKLRDAYLDSLDDSGLNPARMGGE